ncbi:hypothetical protein PanWU01x14_053990 [Parasponia andersonii]|uniref:Uncharacterized protein n=1 Tax=Parasponia andersonii TaxID=3476 RepID=A0A2P5DKM9_PARAD|nr:hypothetical protein PanWU01x14_053990 [Parasponia andersonii]
MSVLVRINSSYVSLSEIFYKALELKPKTYTLEINYTYELGILSIKIVNDHVVKFYIDLKNNELAKTKFPLCVDIIREPMTILHEGLTNNFRVPSYEICFRPPNNNAYYPDMPTHVEKNLELVEMARHENDNLEAAEIGGHDHSTRSFVTECGVTSLEDIFEFETPVVEEEINDEVNTRATHGAMST